MSGKGTEAPAYVTGHTRSRQAAMGGETVIITRNGQPLVQLVPVTVPALKPRFGSAQGLIVIEDDFNEPLADFEPYTR